MRGQLSIGPHANSPLGHHVAHKFPIHVAKDATKL